MLEEATNTSDLIGKRCDDLLCRQFWFGGELQDEAQVLYFHVGNIWYQLYFDGEGQERWGKQTNRPFPSGGPNEQIYYPLHNPGTDMGLESATIEDISSTPHHVAIRFAGHGVLHLQYRDGRSRLQHVPERAL